MRTTVADLLRLPHLRLRLFAGGEGLHREVPWAHASDLDSARDWMTGGELLLRNGSTLPASGPEQDRLLRRIEDAGASGLVIGEDPQTPALRNELAAAAESCRLPVLLAPYSVSFAAIARAVADANAREDTARVARVERVYAAVRDALGGTPSESPVARVSRELGCRLALLDPRSGRPVDPAEPELAPELARAVVDAVRIRHGKIPGVLHLTVPGSGRTLVVEVPASEPTVLVAMDLPGPASDTSLLHHLATVAALDVARHTMAMEYDRRVRAELLAQLMDTRIDEPTAQRKLDALGLDPAACILVAVRRGDWAGQRNLHLTLGRHRVPCLLLNRAPLLFALLPDEATALLTVRQQLGASATFGMSNALGSPGRLPAAQREAVWALSMAASRPDRSARYGDDYGYRALHGIEEARWHVERSLGALLAYDQQHGTDLVNSLEAFLRCRRSWQRAAAALNVHKQTVMYRMQRVEQITGRVLAETSDLADLWLALQARELLDGSGHTLSAQEEQRTGSE
ncbi:PucR family transcriptional regulator [Streptomyces sp. bgisy031]|uniref:PucR family transcriptional regulator n=1 Tax=Streptomyces sp. bgisy031 TaxID=3413772 RepID=UPI003D72BA9A